MRSQVPTSTLSTMLLLVLKGVFLYAVSWVLWRRYRDFFVKSPLDNISWPSSQVVLERCVVVNIPGLISSYLGLCNISVINIKALFGDNQLYFFDPKAMHHIVVKDQYSYEETAAFIEGNSLMFGDGLLGTMGEQHRKQRKMLNPVFSIAHMREMSMSDLLKNQTSASRRFSEESRERTARDFD
ncbi:unnamed protein product [Cyclocybe aegerita]|uniref:Cytochrome P450 n=1 Tax=Cyclocybe aegerita TaxID=1973307 RepID=A0A8S0WIV4_CYCAE|nr:unnamed protein product [Cyclocybe aegerita]